LSFAYMCGGEVRAFSWQPSCPYTWIDLGRLVTEDLLSGMAHCPWVTA